MDRVIGEFFGRAVVELIGMGIDAAVRSYRGENASSHSTQSTQQQTFTLSALPPAPTEQVRAVLTASSTITFGNDCERLVNIAFRTSQSFPSIMGTYADVDQYLRKELAKQYPDECFHVIIGENHGFEFSVEDGQYFAEIQQKRYRVLIFSTKRNPCAKTSVHDANSQMSLVWN